jgi:hypothetical protein
MNIFRKTPSKVCHILTAVISDHAAEYIHSLLTILGFFAPLFITEERGASP